MARPASCEAFLAGTVVADWRRRAEVFPAVLEPITARGDWGGTARFPGGDRKGAAHRGPDCVVTFSLLSRRRIPAFYLVRQPAVGKQMAGASGLLASSGAADLTLRRTFTVSFWRSERDMIAAAYRPRRGTVGWSAGEGGHSSTPPSPGSGSWPPTATGAARTGDP